MNFNYQKNWRLYSCTCVSAFCFRFNIVGQGFLKAGYGQNHILCMACFCSEDSRGDDRRAKFSMQPEISSLRNPAVRNGS